MVSIGCGDVLGGVLAACRCRARVTLLGLMQRGVLRDAEDGNCVRDVASYLPCVNKGARCFGEAKMCY
jgi:hypothetical protein